jgi:hypothetical protein
MNLNTQRHIFKLNKEAFMKMEATLVFHIKRQLETEKINYKDFWLVNFYLQHGYAVFVVDVDLKEEEKELPKISIDQIMDVAKHNDLCYIDYVTLYDYFKRDEDFIVYEVNGKKVTFVPTCMDKPYSHLVRKVENL